MAVAIKEHGYNNIKIYNGGINDWKKAGFELSSISKIPDHPVKFLEAEDLNKWLIDADKTQCLDSNGNPLLTILDLRDNSLQKIIKPDEETILTKCRIVNFLIDDILKPNALQNLPQGKLVLFCETGGRSPFLAKYLYELGRKDVYVLNKGFLNWKIRNFPYTKKTNE